MARHDTAGRQQGAFDFFRYLDHGRRQYYPDRMWKNGSGSAPQQVVLAAQKHEGDRTTRLRTRSIDGVRYYAIDFMTAPEPRWCGICSKPFSSTSRRRFRHRAAGPEAARDGVTRDEVPETPYLGERQYLPHRTHRAAYAAMIPYLDPQIGASSNLAGAIG